MLVKYLMNILDNTFSCLYHTMNSRLRSHEIEIEPCPESCEDTNLFLANENVILTSNFV